LDDLQAKSSANQVNITQIRNVISEINKNTKLDKSRTVAVGDSLFHDIKGANNFKIDSILIVKGVHKELKNIKKIINNHKILPTFYMDTFNV